MTDAAAKQRDKFVIGASASTLDCEKIIDASGKHLVLVDSKGNTIGVAEKTAPSTPPTAIPTSPSSTTTVKRSTVKRLEPPRSTASLDDDVLVNSNDFGIEFVYPTWVRELMKALDEYDAWCKSIGVDSRVLPPMRRAMKNIVKRHS